MFDELEKAMTVMRPVPQKYLEEPRGRFQSHLHALIKPENREELEMLIHWARHFKMPLVPIGGGSGLVGGQIFPDSWGAVGVSMERMNTIKIEGNTALVGAGVILDDLHTALAGTGWQFPMGLASSGSAQIGGLISTNAGGVNVIRYGNMGENVLGLAAVLGDGSRVDHTANLRKDNTGYRVDRLLIGAEGTLGLIGTARLRLVPVDAARAVVMARVDSPEAAQDMLARLQNGAAAINAFELIDGEGLRFRLTAGFDAAPIGEPDWSVLFELGGDAHTIEAALARVADDLSDSVLAQSEAQIDALWGVRETIPLGNRHIGAIASHDISVPLDRIAEFIRTTKAELASKRLRINSFGHLGDGNLHFNLFPAEGRAKSDYDAAALSHIVHSRVVEFGGSISAEHGIGRLKARDLQRYGYDEKLAAMRQVKIALDPDGIMNPGAVIPRDFDA